VPTARLVVPLIVLAIVGGLAVGGLTADRKSNAAALPPGAAGPATPAAAVPDPTSDPTTAAADSELTAAVDKSSATAGETVTISGQLASAESGVRLTVERNLGDGWVTFPSSGVTKSDGTFSLIVKSRRPGENRFRIVAPGDVTSNELSVDISK
jgi:hypothetical protein